MTGGHIVSQMCVCFPHGSGYYSPILEKMLVQRPVLAVSIAPTTGAALYQQIYQDDRGIPCIQFSQMCEA